MTESEYLIDEEEYALDASEMPAPLDVSDDEQSDADSADNDVKPWFCKSCRVEIKSPVTWIDAKSGKEQMSCEHCGDKLTDKKPSKTPVNESNVDHRAAVRLAQVFDPDRSYKTRVIGTPLGYGFRFTFSTAAFFSPLAYFLNDEGNNGEIDARGIADIVIDNVEAPILTPSSAPLRRMINEEFSIESQEIARQFYQKEIPDFMEWERFVEELHGTIIHTHLDSYSPTFLDMRYV